MHFKSWKNRQLQKGDGPLEAACSHMALLKCMVLSALVLGEGEVHPSKWWFHSLNLWPGFLREHLPAFYFLRWNQIKISQHCLEFKLVDPYRPFNHLLIGDSRVYGWELYANWFSLMAFGHLLVVWLWISHPPFISLISKSIKCENNSTTI